MAGSPQTEDHVPGSRGAVTPRDGARPSRLAAETVADGQSGEERAEDVGQEGEPESNWEGAGLERAGLEIEAIRMAPQWPMTRSIPQV